MFEDSLVDSGGKLKTKSKYWMIATFALNGVIVAILILIPLLYPEALPKSSMTAMLTAPPPPPPPPPPPAQIVKPIKMVSEIDAGLHAPTKIPKKIEMVKEEAAPPPQVAGVAGMSGMTGGSAGGVLGGVLGGMGAAPTPVVKAVEKPKGPARISGGVMAGSIITKTQPVYPPIAKAAHVSGTVTLHAIISKTGAIENLTVISGPQMLVSAAMDAVKQWKYKPYLLNGEPTEVDTTVQVNFSFGGS